jgi:iron complex outermembrane recepter protein
MRTNQKLWLSGLSLLALAASPAMAQQAAETEDTGGIADIVVTAQKRAENLQDVPISIAAITGDMVADRAAVTLQGLQGAVPNVEIGTFSNTPNTAVFTIRGIGVIEPDPYAGNTVGIVSDGVPQYFSMGALLDLYDVDRIEILRGPQGTLFGANTTGGVVNVVNAQPEIGEFNGKATLGYGNYSHFNGGAAINVPMGESLAARFTISNDQRKGWVTNVVDGSDMGKRNVTIFRAAMKYAPSDDFDITLSGEYDRARNGAPVVVAGDLPGEAEFVPAGFRNMYVSPCLPAGSRCEAPDRYFSANDGGALGEVQDRSDMDTYRGTATINIRNTGIGDITAITGYKKFKLFEFTDQDGTPIFLIDTRRQTKGWQFSQELRTDIEVNDSIDLLLGGFYMKTHYDHYQHLRIEFGGGVTYDTVLNTVTKGLPGLFQRNLQEQDNNSLSFFAQSYFKLSDQLKIQAGIRYTHEKTSMLASTATSLSTTGVTTFDGVSPNGAPNIDLGTVAPPLGRKSWNNVGWKLGLDYKPGDDVLLYAYWARGFKSGGFTGRIGLPTDLGPYDPEEVDTFEWGVKADFLDKRLRTNLSAFYTNYRDMQLAQIYFIGTVQGNTILNAASSRIKGIEAEVIAVPLPGLTLTGSVAYLSAKYKDFLFALPDNDANPLTPPPVIDLAGQRLQNAPKWTGAIGFNYEFPIGDMGGRIGATYTFASEKLLTSIIDTPRARVQPQNLLNANADITINEKITLGIWGTNILDKRYINSVFDAPGTLGLVNYAPPRQYGMSAKIVF